MRSYPCLIPLSDATVARIQARVARLPPYQTVYGAFWYQVRPTHKRVVHREPGADKELQGIRASLLCTLSSLKLGQWYVSKRVQDVVSVNLLEMIAAFWGPAATRSGLLEGVFGFLLHRIRFAVARMLVRS